MIMQKYLKVRLLETGQDNLLSSMKELEHILVNMLNNMKVRLQNNIQKHILEQEHSLVNIQTTIRSYM